MTVYPRIAAPPVVSATRKLTVAAPFSAEALTPRGALGAVIAERGVTELDGIDDRLVPCALVAVTVNV